MLQSNPHQIVQSPARLGLPNPNSPSLQNSTPPKFSSQQPNKTQQPSNQSTTTPSALLSLLPPLPRAQSLLLQMASLSSKLFEVSPNRSHWISAFRGSLPSFLSHSFDSPFSSAKEIIAEFTTLQTQLFEAVAQLQEILDLQDAKQKLAREIKNKDSSLLTFANKLREVERVLDVLVDDYSDYRRIKRTKSSDTSTTTIETKLKLSDILSYAHKISYTTFAPPEFGAGSVPLRGALPPAPQEEQMRASQLYNFTDLDIGLPKTDVGEEKIIEPLLFDTRAEGGVSSRVQGLMIPSNIVIPSGWKPGMPVELPSDLPVQLPPPGWKPGDPIALPPLDFLPVVSSRAEQLRPVQASGSVRGPEPIQVRHVELDIEDDDSSDYSSDVDSSDSED